MPTPGILETDTTLIENYPTGSMLPINCHLLLELSFVHMLDTVTGRDALNAHFLYRDFYNNSVPPSSSSRVFSEGVQPKKIVQMVSQYHHPTFCPLIPKLCSVKSEH